MPGSIPLRALRLLALLPLCVPASGAQTQADQPPMEFKGRLLVIASDGDMQAQAYAGDTLGEPARDAVSVIKLDGAGRSAAATSLEVPNSVVGPPASLTVTPDGRYAIVIETKGARPANQADARLKDLPPGRAITVVDLSDPDAPTVVQRLAGRGNPVSVSIRADGTLVAIAYDTADAKGAPLDLRDFANGRLGEPFSPQVPGFATGDNLKNAAFAPDGTLALVYKIKPRLSLLRVVTAGRSTRLVRWGNDVPLGRSPFEVRFTPDGRFALVNDMYVPEQGTDVRGTITSIAVNASRSQSGDPQHRIVSQARTGVMPEGLVISPDARLVATTNLERTAYAPGDPHQGFFASITLLRLDAGDGRLSRVGDYPFAGVIPETAAFDNTSRYLATVSFDHIGPKSSRGSVDFWRVVGDFQDASRLELVPTGHSIPIPRGAHSMEIVR